MTQWLSNFPVYLAYVIFPFVMIVDRAFFSVSVGRNWVDLLFLLWGGAAFLHILSKGHVYKVFSIKKEAFRVLVLFFFIIVFLKYYFQVMLSDNEIYAIPAMMEFKPVFYFILASVGAMAFSPVNQRTVVKSGMVLAFLVFISVCLESYEAGRLVRAHGSGEMNYDAFLLLIAFIISIFSKNIKFTSLCQTIIFVGLLFSMSRTVLLILLICILFISHFSLYKKLLLSTGAVLVIIVSFIVRDLPIDQLESMDRYWMWKSSLEYLLNDFGVMLWGAAPGTSLDIYIPPNLEWLWSSQAEGWGLEGVFPFHLHSMWLRMFATWGGIFVIIFLSAILFYYKKTANNIEKSLLISICVGATSMGIFYLSNVSIVLLLVFMSIGYERISHAKIK